MSKKVYTLSATPIDYSPLLPLATPETLDDIAIQMSGLVGDCSDVEIVHKEADRLLLRALNTIKAQYKLTKDDNDAIDDMIIQFDTLGKWYD